MGVPTGHGNERASPTLPLELILHVIESLRPDQSNVILYPYDNITKTLMATRLVCKAVNSIAVKILLQHCMYIGTNRKAQRLATFLNTPDEKTGISEGFKSLFSNISSVRNLALSLFPYQEENDDAETPSEPLAITTEPQHSSQDGTDNITDSDVDDMDDWLAENKSPLKDMPTALAVRDILLTVAPSLRVLVINMPLRSLYREQDHQGVRPILRQGFEALINLEEFCSIQDELYLDMIPGDEPVWAKYWLKLRCLQLYNPIVGDDDEIWMQMAKLPCLEMVVFARADPGDLERVDIKRAWLDAVDSVAKGSDEVAPLSRLRKMTIALANCTPLQPIYKQFKKSWHEVDPEGDVRVLLADIPIPTKYHNNTREWEWSLDSIGTTQRCVMEAAVSGEIWDDAGYWMRDATSDRPGKKSSSYYTHSRLDNPESIVSLIRTCFYV